MGAPALALEEIVAVSAGCKPQIAAIAADQVAGIVLYSEHDHRRSGARRSAA
jgi:hypothetical protein